jgi:hypothetical protein
MNRSATGTPYCDHGRITVYATPSRIGDRPVISPDRVGEQTGNE